MNTKNLNWPIIIFLVAYQLIVLAAAPFYFYYAAPSTGMIIAAVVAFLATGISITAGYHRLYSHSAYKANKVVEVALLFIGTMAGQGSVLRWSNDHRIHHSHLDTEKDPYSIKKGFWHAHMLWLFENRPPINDKLVADLNRNKLIVFQDKHYGVLFVLTNLIVSLLVGYFLGDMIGAIYLVWWLRLFAVHHSTWFINSLAHTWGSKSYSREFSAVDNYLISLLTFGEGYHNYHHFFATDYRNGIRWYHFDPTKWLIWSLNKLGLASNLRRIDQFKIQKQVLKNDKDLLISKIEQFAEIKTEVVERKIQETFDAMMRRMSEMKELKEQYMAMKKEEAMQHAIGEVKKEINQVKDNLYQDFKTWQLMFDRIMAQKPLFV